MRFLCEQCTFAFRKYNNKTMHKTKRYFLTASAFVLTYAAQAQMSDNDSIAPQEKELNQAHNQMLLQMLPRESSFLPW